MKNFSELISDSAVLVGRSGDASYLEKIKVWMNISEEFLFRVYDYWLELQDIHNFSSVASQEDNIMPKRFDKPLRIYDLDNNKHITIDTEVNYFDANIKNIVDAKEGVPETARLYGISPVTTQVATTGDTVKLKSSSSSDSNNPVGRVEGFIDSALTTSDSETITISSSSPTTFVAGTKTFYKLTNFSKSADTTGFLTLANSSDETLEILAAQERVARHKILKLGLIPNAVISYRILMKKRITKMVDDGDYPFVDADDFLMLNSSGYALAQDREPGKAQIMWAKAKEALNAILLNQMEKLGPDYQMKINNIWSQSHRV